MLLALFMIVGAGQTWAANPTTLTVGGTNVLDGSYWKTNADGTLTAEGASAEDYNVYYDGNGVLTLNNANITGTSSTDYGAAIYAVGDLTIELNGSSNATGAVHSSDMPFSGLYVSGTLTISGEGSLTVSAAENTNGSKNNYGIYAITYIQNGGSITSQSGTGAASRGVYAYSGMTVNGGSLTATGGTATNQDSSGIYVTGTITVGSATVTATGGTGTNSYGIYSSCTSTNSLTVTGGTVTATSNSSPIYIETIVPNGGSAQNHVSVTVSNSGSITAQGGAGIVLKSSQHAGGTGTGSMTVESGCTLLANSVTVNNNPLAPTGEGSWLIYGQSDQESPMHGNVTLSDNLTIETENTFTIPAGSTLTVPEGVTLTVDGTLANQGTLAIANGNSLTGSGTLSGDGSFVATAVTDVTGIVVPEGVTCADYREKVALGGPTVLGVPFLVDAEGWTLSFEPGVCTPNGCTYTATATNGSKTLSQTFTALHRFDEAEGKCPCGASQAQTDAQGRYQLADAFQLRWFAALVNGTLTNGTAQNAAANAVLTKNIDLTGEDWTPIGNASTIYTGTFDGQNHTISGMKIDNAESYSGLFGNVTGTVRDFTVTGSITLTGSENISKVGGAVGSLGTGTAGGTVSGVTSGVDITVSTGNDHIGGVVGSMPENCSPTVESCLYTGNINVTVAAGSVAGVVGYIRTGTIQNCANRGGISVSGSGNGSVGGILGYCNNKGISILSCYNTGIIKAESTANVGAIVGNNRDDANHVGQATVSNCCYLTGSADKGQGQLDTDAAGTAVKTADEFKSGAVAILLQGDQTAQAWGQALGTDNLPVPTTDEDRKVYAYSIYKGSDAAETGYANSGNAIRLEGNAVAVVETAGFTAADGNDNVIVKNSNDTYTCNKFVLTDGADFYSPVTFTAGEATYSRTLPATSTWGTVVLPFESTTTDATLYEATEIVADGSEEGLLGVSETDNNALKANTPALLKANTPGTTVGFSATGATVEATTANSPIEKAIGESGYSLTGTMKAISPLTQDCYFISADKFWSVGSQTTVGMKAFRACISAPAASGVRPSSMRIVVGGLTGIDHVGTPEDEPVDVYTTDGRLMRRGVNPCSALNGLPHGIYIVGGKKVSK